MIASRLPPANSAIGGYFGLNRHERRGTQQIRAISVHRRETCDWIIGKGKVRRVNQVPEVLAINTGRSGTAPVAFAGNGSAVLTDQ